MRESLLFLLCPYGRSKGIRNSKSDALRLISVLVKTITGNSLD